MVLVENGQVIKLVRDGNLMNKSVHLYPFPKRNNQGYTKTNLDEGGTKNIAIPCMLEMSAICRCSYNWLSSSSF